MIDRQLQLKRLKVDVRDSINNVDPTFSFKHVNDNLFIWHFSIAGPEGSEYENGFFHGEINLSHDYPLKPPTVRIFNLNGRFEPNVALCLPLSSHHEETWNVSTRVIDLVKLVQSIIPVDDLNSIGTIHPSPEVRKAYVAESRKYVCINCGPINSILGKPVTIDNHVSVCCEEGGETSDNHERSGVDFSPVAFKTSCPRSLCSNICSSSHSTTSTSAATCSNQLNSVINTPPYLSPTLSPAPSPTAKPTPSPTSLTPSNPLDHSTNSPTLSPRGLVYDERPPLIDTPNESVFESFCLPEFLPVDLVGLDLESDADDADDADDGFVMRESYALGDNTNTHGKEPCTHKRNRSDRLSSIAPLSKRLMTDSDIENYVNSVSVLDHDDYASLRSKDIKSKRAISSSIAETLANQFHISLDGKNIPDDDDTKKPKTIRELAKSFVNSVIVHRFL